MTRSSEQSKETHMSQKTPGPPIPTAEHRRLLKKVGEWAVQCTYFWGAQPMTVTGSDRLEALGGFWTDPGRNIPDSRNR